MDRNVIQNELKSIAASYIPGNCRQYKWGMCDNQPGETMFGVKRELQPFEGKVVHISQNAIYVKVKRNTFYAVDAGLVTMLPAVGDTVRVTPYARRHFDGTRTDAPKVETYTLPDGTTYQSRVVAIGHIKTELPVSHEEYACYELNEMLKQLECLPAADGFRSISQMLYDAGARDFEVIDSSPENIIKIPPRIRFSVDNRKHCGQVDVIYDRGMDTYRIELLCGESVVESIRDVYFDDLGSVLGQLVDDGSWNRIGIEILAPAKSRKRH